MYTVLLLGLLSICLYFMLWSRSGRALQCLGHLPTYPYLPITGNMHWFIGGSRALYKHLIEISNIIEAAQLPFVGWVGPKPAIVVSDPTEAKMISNAFIEKPDYYKFGREWVGDGLVTAPGDIWKRNVKKIAGSFTRATVDGYQDIFNVQARNLTQAFKMKVDSEPFHALDACSLVTLETICQTALGVSGISDSIVTDEYYRAFNRTFEILTQRALNIVYHVDWIFRLTSSYKEMLANIAVMHKVSETVMKKRKIERERGTRNSEGIDTKQPFKAFIDVMLDLNESDPSFTEQQIKSEVATIVLGGQETVATTTMMCLLMIGSHLEVQEKLYAELNEIFKDTRRDVTKEDLERMVYCEAVINETMRLFPPVPAVMRSADRDLKLESCTIPKGTTCVLNIWGAGRSRRIWTADSENFKPERWMNEALPPLLAFSIGKRACIGKKYAMSSLKTMLAHCIRELQFSSDVSNIQFKLDVILRPIRGHLMRVRLRETEHSYR